MSEQISERFDYDSLDEETRAFVLQQTAQMHGLMQRTVEDVIQIGHHLLAARKSLQTANHGKNGLFLAWLQAEFRMPHPTAYRFIQIATRFADQKLPRLGSFTLSILYDWSLD